LFEIWFFVANAGRGRCVIALSHQRQSRLIEDVLLFALKFILSLKAGAPSARMSESCLALFYQRGSFRLLVAGEGCGGEKRKRGGKKKNVKGGHQVNSKSPA